jgi:hypothetical protein
MNCTKWQAFGKASVIALITLALSGNNAEAQNKGNGLVCLMVKA